jgi:alpha/beta superfamily hydrolase
VIMGGKDDRMGPDWVDKLVSRGIAVHVIPGASHFFDNQYEFDLQEAVLQFLKGR